MEREYSIGADQEEATVDFVLPTGLSSAKWIRAVDLRPGTPSIVRDAVISIENGPILEMWITGSTRVPAPAGTGFRLTAGSRLHLRIHYKKPWQEAHVAKSDQSAVGVYFAADAPPVREIQASTFKSPSRPERLEARTALAGATPAARVLAIRPSIDRPYRSVDIHAVTPSGATVPLLRLRGPHPEWRERYWLANPVDLPAESRIEASLTPFGISDGEAARLPTSPFEVTLDYVAP
jgi:hypothetical protein